MNKKRILAAAVALCFAVTGTIGTSASVFATGCWSAPTSPISIDGSTLDANGNVTNTVITAAGHRAAQTLVEIVGLDNKACQNMAGNKDGIVDGDSDQLDPAENVKPAGMYDTQQEAGDNCKILGVFGSDLNSNPDPYYYNYYYNLYANTTGKATPVATTDTVLCIKSTLSPNVADTLIDDRFGGVSASVYSKADILVGTTTKASQGATQTYPEYIKALYDSTDEYDGYNPVVFTYKYTDVYQEGESLQRLAVAMNNIETANGGIKTDELNTAKGTVGRYGNPLVTANDYQLYIKGLSAYVVKKMNQADIEKKTAVVIDPASSTAGQTGDANMPGTGWFRAYSNETKDGLATRTRGAECIENVTTNLLQEYVKDATTDASDATTVYQYNDSSDGTAYAISESVVKEADVIVIQGAQSKIGVFTKAEFENYMKTNYGWTDADLAGKTIIAENPQCVYGLTCNSSETAMGYGFYMGYIYPEILDPVDAIAYFYKRCLHITDETALQKFMDTNVATAVANMADPSTELSDNWEDTITADIREGVDYFQGLSKTAKAEFKFQNRVATGADVETGIFTSTYNEKTVNTILETSEYDLANIDTSKIKLAATKYTYNGKAKTPAVTIEGLTAGKDFKVSYSNNTNVGTASAIIEGMGSYVGTLKATFSIVKGTQTLKVTNYSKTYKRSAVKKASKSFTLKTTRLGSAKVTYSKKTGSSKLKVTSAGKVTLKKGTKKGTYKAIVTVKAAATSNYNAKTITKTVIVKVK